MITDIKKFTATFDRIAHGKSPSSVFTDFLDMVICALSLGQYEEEYLLIVKKYKREEVDLFCELLAELLIVMDNDGAGLKDALGEFYQQNLSNKKAGEFFTPPHVAELMAQMTMDETTRGKEASCESSSSSVWSLPHILSSERQNCDYNAASTATLGN